MRLKPTTPYTPPTWSTVPPEIFSAGKYVSKVVTSEDGELHYKDKDRDRRYGVYSQESICPTVNLARPAERRLSLRPKLGTQC